MADGIPYVPLDCHFDDDKIPMIEAEFGLEGFAIVVKLFQKIYGGLGYYCEWNDRVALLFARQIGAGGNVVREVAAASIREGIFDKGMYEKFGVLTSRGIQKRFMNVAKRRRQIFNKPEYVLIRAADFSSDVDISAENVCNSGENVCNSETSKVKGSEVKVSKENGSEAAAPPAHTRASLVSLYGESAVADYGERFRRWNAARGSTSCAVNYAVIARWMAQDGVTAGQYNANQGSFDVDEVMERKMREFNARHNGSED